MITKIKETWHGGITAIKSLLPCPSTFIYYQNYINIGGIMAKIKRICEQCGKEFETLSCRVKEGKAIFCSNKCKSEYRKKREIRICEVCKKEFEIHSYRAETARFCSQKCAAKWLNINMKRGFQKGTEHWNWKGGKKECVCLECSKTFLTNLSELRRGGSKFCSKECYWEYQSKDRNVFERFKKMRRSITKPTKPELIFKEICKRNNLDFHYVGDGSLWIGKKGEKQLNPDFIEANGKKICVEVMGAYWHSPLLLNPNLRKTSLLSYRKKHYKRFKWQPIFIWDTDLLREDTEQFVLNLLGEKR